MRNNYNSEQDALNRDIQAAMMRTNDIYAAIGRKFYSENSQGQVSAEYAQMFSDLKATSDQIENMQTRIKFLNGIVVCTGCKAENSVNSSFCAVCGTRLPHTFAQDGALRCPRCGNIVQPGQKFCGVCGNVVEAAPQAPQAAPQGGFVPSEQQNPDAKFMPQDQTIVVSETTQPEQAEVEQPVHNDEPETVTQEVIDAVNVAEGSSEAVAAQTEGPAVCPQCGSPIKAADALFCAECGYRLK